MAHFDQHIQGAAFVEKHLGYKTGESDVSVSATGDPLTADEVSGTETAEKIVNEYGRVLSELNRCHKEKVAALLERAKSDQVLEREINESLESASGPYYRLLARKENKDRLPYSRQIIKSAIRLLLKHETEPDNKAMLRSGLAYLEWFE